MTVTKSGALALSVMITGATLAMAEENVSNITALPATFSNWHGFKLHAFKTAGTQCKVVVPHEAAEGKPWIWRARFFGHEPQGDIALLEQGFHLVYCDISGLFGAPPAVARWDAFYAFATQELGLSEKVGLIGFSRGGLIVFNWAMANPEKVACIYGDAPVCDIKSWPGGKGTGKGALREWRRCQKVFGFADEADALAFTGNPVDHAAALAKVRIPVLIVYGKDDTVVPPAENAHVFETHFKAAGGDITLIGKDNNEHHPHSLKDPKPIVDFVLKSYGMDRVDSAGLPAGIELRRGLSNSGTRFAEGAQARVAFLGGSITEMQGWRNHVADSLKKRYPDTTFDFVFGGISSTDSTMGAFRLEKDIFKNGTVDLLFIESAVNELHNSRTKDDIGRAVEGIIRHAHAHNPNIDIVAQYFYDPGHMNELRGGKTAWQIEALNRVSVHYDIPSIDQVVYLATALDGDRISQKEFGGCHPAPKGHLLYIESIDQLFDAAWANDGQRGAHVLPAALRPDHFEQGTFLDIKAATLGEGWAYVQKWAPPRGGTRKQYVNVPVLETTAPGGELTLAFTGSAIGIVLPAGYDVGILEYKVDQAAFKQQDLFTKWSKGLHIPWIYMLETNLSPGAHTLTLRMADSKNARSEGTACRICAFAVNPH